MTSQLPPVELRRGRAPIWSRPALFRRSGAADVRTLKRDKLHSREDSPNARGRPSPTAHARDVAAARMERQVAFLKAQHGDTLTHLHAEVERLKAENRGGGKANT